MNNKKILIVDDELVGRQLLQAFLMVEGYETNLAENGYEALKIAEASVPDLVLLDIMMPELDGYEVVKKLRGNDKFKNTPIIMVTALDDRDSKLKGLDAGADDYISKPYDRIEILEKIKNILLLYSNKELPAIDIDELLDNNNSGVHNLISESLAAADTLGFTKKSLEFAGNNFASESNYGVWTYKKNKATYTCLFGPSRVDKTTGYNNALIASWHWNMIKNPPKSVQEFSYTIEESIKASKYFDISSNPWWYICIEETISEKSLAGFNQVMFINDGSDIESNKSLFKKITLQKSISYDIRTNLEIILFSGDVLQHFSNKELIEQLNQPTFTDIQEMKASFKDTDKLNSSYIIKLTI